KLLKVIAIERSPQCENDFVREVSQYPADYLAFLDETSKNDKTPSRCREHSRKGKRAVKRQKAVRGRRVTATGVLTACGIVACEVVEGSMH
ncbi:hypothetical protein FB451DRAFT_963676, partial [Mycena latifolia]